MARFVRLLLVFALAMAGFALAAGHAHPRAGAPAVASIAHHCHDEGAASDAPAAPTAVDDLACSVLCCAIAPQPLAQLAMREITRVALAFAPERADSHLRRPPAPPPRA